MSELAILHRPAAAGQGTIPGILAWTTCRRQIFFASTAELPALERERGPLDEILVGAAAEALVVEVLAGLRSPLIGETEVFGQFRLWFEQAQASDWARAFAAHVQDWFAQVKKIRERHLRGAGQASYGSLLRQLVGEEPEAAFLGAGQLVAECVPWLAHRQVRIFCRRPEAALALGEAHRDLTIHRLDAAAPAPIVIVAAPLNAAALAEWLRTRPDTRWLIDLRRDATAPAGWAGRYTSLDDLTRLLEGRQGELVERRQAARADIARWVGRRECRAQLRPFGWEDLCG